MSKKTKFVLISAVVTTSVLLSGCGLFGGDNAAKEIDPPKDVTYVKDEKSLATEAKVTEANKKQSKAAETSAPTKREIYLIDKNGYVVSQTLEIPKSKGVAKQSLEYLVEGGPVTNLLPNNFRAVLPADTRVLGTKLESDGTMVADFSPEFAEYKKEDELRILQAVTWTLTQFEGVNKVKIRINGYDKDEMPVNHTPISKGLSRVDGINFDNTGVVDVTQTKPVTIYYLAQEGKQTYYVPVTKRIASDDKDMYTAIVNELVEGPAPASGLVTDFNPDAKLVAAPKYADGQLTLNFNKNIFGNLKGTEISQYVLDSLVLSLTEQKAVDSVAIKVNGKKTLKDEKGKKLTEPVSRPKNVNTGSF
ncbi:GerMN domain-containing protein [Priestia megaterium]|uniref:GerMN domain-containing protein n=1 Tax=Priestia megaterium TaxID=1404 RepID=UPI0012B8ADB6|nr:GerMN domain-containing protein [Priestia megaterium]